MIKANMREFNIFFFNKQNIVRNFKNKANMER